MASQWGKTNCLLVNAAAFWLTALSPVPAIAKGISYSLALMASVQLVQESKWLMIHDARRIILSAMRFRRWSFGELPRISRRSRVSSRS
ncbi:MAG: hypothetical protein V7L29_19375 [Nostoc sp.]|uniref:hypothetical protein n=1 Tax=Nostoc sp. TaxID=1180 RepID=UPI002FF7A0DF